jgi:hypothetical protein
MHVYDRTPAHVLSRLVCIAGNVQARVLKFEARNGLLAWRLGVRLTLAAHPKQWRRRRSLVWPVLCQFSCLVSCSSKKRRGKPCPSSTLWPHEGRASNQMPMLIISPDCFATHPLDAPPCSPDISRPAISHRHAARENIWTR